MFLLNSRLGLFNVTLSRSESKSLHANGAPLLPKLRGHFAEFLNERYFERLSIFYSSTCVGLGTVTYITGDNGFSRKRSLDHFGFTVVKPQHNLSARRPTSVYAHIQPCADLAFSVTLSLITRYR